MKQGRLIVLIGLSATFHILDVFLSSKKELSKTFFTQVVIKSSS